MPKPKTQIIEPIDGSLDEVSSKIFNNIKIDLPKALYKGVLPIAGSDLDCVVLNDGRRIITATAIFDAFDRARKGMNDRLEINGTKIPPFLAAKNLEPYVTKDVLERTKLIEYQDGTSKKTGYVATLIPKMCEVYLSARRNNDLIATQQKLAIKAELLLSALAQVGIDALVDEATGYQYDRKHDALRILLNQYVAEGMQKWMKMFPDSFFECLDKLYGNETTTSQKRPQYYGGFINRHIYEPIEHGYVKQELDKLNITDQGKRKGRFHQWLNDNGKNILMMQIGKVQGVMELFDDIDSFKKAIKKQKTISVAPYLFDEMNNIIE